MTIFFVRVIAALVALAFALIPSWIYLMVRAVLAPIGFWQNSAFLMIVLVLAWFQIRMTLHWLKFVTEEIWKI